MTVYNTVTILNSKLLICQKKPLRYSPHPYMLKLLNIGNHFCLNTELHGNGGSDFMQKSFSSHHLNYGISPTE